jgi:prevent-host-death family protein
VLSGGRQGRPLKPTTVAKVHTVLNGALKGRTEILRLGRCATCECGYDRRTRVATTEVDMVEAGIRELRNHLSKYLDRVRAGEELIVTDRGTAIARVVPIEGGRVYDDLVADGVIEPSSKERTRPAVRVVPKGPVSDLVTDQRR